MNQWRFAFAGFRHPHILELYQDVANHPDCVTVAAAEADEKTRNTLLESKKADITFSSIEKMLDSVECDIVAVGDCYGKRGAIVIDALKRGKHVIADKPLCTSLAELDEIRKLSAEKHLAVGCMYTLRDFPAVSGIKKLIADGSLGEIHQIQFTAQHPLLRNTRAGWYFENGMHGGTINDIGCHAFDMIPYITGIPIKKVTAARCWQALEKESAFADAAQFMLELANGCGVMGDVSYMALTANGYSHPAYWRFNIWGSKGMVEFHPDSTTLHGLFKDEENEVPIALPEKPEETYFAGFLKEISGEKSFISTQTVLEAAYWSLLTQQTADRADA